MRKLAVGALTVAAFAVGLSLNVFSYGSAASLNGGIVVSSKVVPACVGFETRGSVGFFGGIDDGCDF